MTNVTDSKKISESTRLLSMFLDHVFMTMIATLFFIPILIEGFVSVLKPSHEQANLDFIRGPNGYIAIAGFALYFCKDIINGRSIAKRLFNLQIVDNKTGEVASPMKCFIRNITCVLWPIEVLAAQINSNRRIGDRIAGTRLVPFDTSLQQPRQSLFKPLLPIGISYGLIFLLWQAMPIVELPERDYRETSYNPTESKKLEQLLTDSLGEYLIPDIKIYDTIKNEEKKHLSIILQFKENHISDDNDVEQLHAYIEKLIYAQFPYEKIQGSIQYVYEGRGQFQTKSRHIETNRNRR